MKKWLGRKIAQIITSTTLRDFARHRHAFSRNLFGRKPTVIYFHQFDDPYSQQCEGALHPLQSKYDIEIKTFAVSAPNAAAAPEADLLRDYAIRDAATLARELNWPPTSHSDKSLLPPDTLESRNQGDALRKSLGHYLSAMFYFEGEWYWGLDRLAFLEARLAPFRRHNAPTSLLASRLEIECKPASTSRSRPRLDAYISFRSPYTYLAIPRLTKLAQHYGADLRLRFVLPMVMRGLPVPIAKQLYITRDCKREAERLNMSFGNIADPIGKGAERGLAVLNHALPLGKGEAFAMSFLQGVFADGIDAATDKGLKQIADRAGINWQTVTDAICDPSWRNVVEINRKDMFAGGVWGVPSFRVNDGPIHWGQDRLWAIESELRAAAQLA